MKIYNLKLYKSACLFLCLCVVGCASDFSPESYLSQNNLFANSHAHFSHCYDYGCNKTQNIALSDAEFLKITQPLQSRNIQTAAQERQALKDVIGHFEKTVGAIAGTDQDKFGTFRSLSNTHKQHDCVDESLNTTIYLQLLSNAGALKFHKPGFPATRLPVIHGGRWPHRSAVIIETQTQTKYAVDSWFHDNGQAAEIVSLNQWKEGWKPQ